MSLRIYGNRQLKPYPDWQHDRLQHGLGEAVFNIWQGTIAGCRWLDLCTGSGSMAAEAFMSRSRICIGHRAIGSGLCGYPRELAEGCYILTNFKVLKGDVVQRLKTLKGEQFDRIYFDPPYASDLYEPVLETIVQLQLLTPDGEMAVEHAPDRQIPTPDGLEVCRQKVYGNTALTFYWFVNL